MYTLGPFNCEFQINPPMAKGGGGCPLPPPNRFFQLFSEMGRAFLQNKFSPVGSSLGHLSMKTFFQIRPTVLALKLDKERVLMGGNHPPPPIEQTLTYFSNHEDDIQSISTFVWSEGL